MTTPQGFAAGPPGAVRPIRWGPVLGIMVAVIVPTVFVGFVLGTLMLPIQVLLDHPNAVWLLNVPPGLLAGLLLGVVLTPSRRRLPIYLGASEVLTAGVVLLLLGLAQLRSPGSTELDPFQVLLGVLLTVGVQSLLAGGLWWWKGRATAEQH